MDSEVSCHILAMVLYYLTLGTRQNSRTLFPLFAAKTPSRIFAGFGKFSNKVAIPESKCLFGNRDGRLIRVAQQQLLLLRVWHFAVSQIPQDENNSLLGTNNVHLDTNNSLMGSKHVFRDTSNSLLGTNKFLVERKIAFRGAASDHSQAKQTSLLQRFEFCKQGFERTVSDSDYENTVKIIACDSHAKRNSSFGEVSVTDGPAKVNLFRKPDLRRQLLRMMSRRSRDREPSRISLTKLLRLMKCRKLRKKHKKLFTKSFPVSSVLHNIASNYKQWNIRYIQSLDCFYSSYFAKIKKSTVAVYNESEKIFYYLEMLNQTLVQ